MTTYPLLLSLQNFMPVLLSAAALWNLVRIALVLLYTVTSFGLSGLAAAGARTLALQWTEQLVSTLGAAALLWAAVRMQRAVRNSETNT